MPGKDWLPHREQDFVDLCERWKIGLADPAQAAVFAWNLTEVKTASDKIGAFLTARAVYKKNDSTRNRIAKNEARNEAKNAMRDFANTSIRFNKLMKGEDKLYYGIRPANPTSVRITAPTTFPEAETDTSIIRQITIRFWDSGSKKRGKPHGVHGAEIRWVLLDHPPASKAELINSDFATASPFTLRFGEEDRGKRLYFCLRWESTTNLKGPFGEIYSAVIP
jgi:hypothetical protein